MDTFPGLLSRELEDPLTHSRGCYLVSWRIREHPNQKNIYGAALALIAIMYGIMQGIIAVASLLATMALYGNGRDPQ